ncbi:MAG: hypothetical protein K0S51_1223 [Bacillales bacterium]|jgi:hypothetical protein|nr:hypothetical protein [Bacillales bacterium]
MKKLTIILTMFFALSSLTACSSNNSMELVKSKVSIIKDKDKLGAIVLTEGVNKGKEVVPTALYYEIILKKANNQKIGDVNKEKINFKIVPSKDLKDISNRIIGFNIFNQEEYSESGLGYGESISSSFKPNKEVVYIAHFDLGVDIVDPQGPIKTPAQKELKKLKEKALDATLIVYKGEKEISRLKLK